MGCHEENVSKVDKTKEAEFEILRMKLGNSITKYFRYDSRENSLINDSKINYIVCSIEGSKDLDELKLTSCKDICWFMSKKSSRKTRRSKL